MPIFKASKLNIPPVFLDRWSNPGLEKFLDHAYHFAIVLVVSKRILFPSFLPRFSGLVLDRIDNLLARSDCFRDQTENLWFDVRPDSIRGLRDSNEIWTIEY